MSSVQTAVRHGLGGSRPNHVGNPVALLDEMLLIFESSVRALLDRCPVKAVYFGTAPMRLAVVTTILDGGDRAFVLDMYTKLCRHDTADLLPIGHAVLRYVARERPRATDVYGTLARGLRVFDGHHAHHKQIRPEVTGAADNVRRLVQTRRADLPRAVQCVPADR